MTREQGDGPAPQDSVSVRRIHRRSSSRPEALRAPWAASIAGIAFAVLFTAALLLVRTCPSSRGDEAIAQWFAEGGDEQP
jgi:hypothetical protein